MASCSGSDVRHGEECAARPAKRRVVTAYLGFPSSLADPLAQRRVRPAKYLISKPSAAPPGGFSGYYRIAFYNVSSSDEPYHMDGLATEISEMVHDTCADAVGIGGMSSVDALPATLDAQAIPAPFLAAAASCCASQLN